MQISLKIIQSINHAKSIVCIKFQLLVTFSSLFTGASSLSVFPRGVLYISRTYLTKETAELELDYFFASGIVPHRDL